MPGALLSNKPDDIVWANTWKAVGASIKVYMLQVDNFWRVVNNYIDNFEKVPELEVACAQIVAKKTFTSTQGKTCPFTCCVSTAFSTGTCMCSCVVRPCIIRRGENAIGLRVQLTQRTPYPNCRAWSTGWLAYVHGYELRAEQAGEGT